MEDATKATLPYKVCLPKPGTWEQCDTYVACVWMLLSCVAGTLSSR